jgi:excisionase family DNA binding protein
MNQKPEASPERLIPIWEAADRLGVSPYTIRYWVQHGRIASHKLGEPGKKAGRRLIPLSEIERLIEESRQPATKEMLFT